MAKKKENEVILETKEEELVTDEVIEEEVIEEVAKAPEHENQFIYTQLKMINKMNNPAKARRLASRVLRNKK